MKLHPKITDSLTLKFAELAREKNNKGEQIISLGLGEPVFKTPDIIIKDTIKAINDGFTRYSNPSGLFGLREAIVDKFKVDNNIITKPENIIVTSGAKQAMMLTLMSVLEPEDEVINFTPCYVSYVPQIKIAEPTATIHNIDLIKEDFSIDWDLFSRLINKKTKVVIVNSPNNPTGKMLSKNDFLELTKRIEKFNCYLISDEIYEKLVFGSITHYSPGSIDNIKDRVITINGYSKAFAMTGWRIGFLAAPEIVVRKIIKLQQHINTNTVTFIQKGVYKAFKIKEYGLTRFNESLVEKVDYMMNVFSKQPKLSFLSPDGGIFSFVNIKSTGLDSDSFATQLLNEYNVAVTPGIGFGNNWDDHVRLSMVINREQFFMGIDLMNDFVKNKIK
jgi:aspartate aminotransferase